jgi:quercetin dioxygenase-like cupin family protein
MYIKDLKSKGKFSSEKPCKEDILKSDNFNIVVVNLKKDQEIKPHPEPYAVFFFVMDGKGIFTSEEGEKELNKGDSIFMNSDKIRGIKCIEKLSILGVQDGH